MILGGKLSPDRWLISTSKPTGQDARNPWFVRLNLVPLLVAPTQLHSRTASPRAKV